MANSCLRKNSMMDSSDALAELLTLTVTVDQWGTRRYRNSQDELHRQHGPAVEYLTGTKYWFLNGQRHRIDGPAMEYADGDKSWWLNDQRHRIDGPAIEWANGDKWWYQYGKRHRTEGPAVECANGTRRWWLNGKHLSEEEFHDSLKMMN